MTVRQRAKGNGEREGLTLIEITVALAIGATVALAVFGLFRSGYALQRRTTQGVAVGDAAFGLDLIVRALREASHDPNSMLLWSTGPVEARYDAVAVQSARLAGRDFDVANEGQPSWNGWIGFIYDAGRQAVREVRFPAVEDIPAPPWEGGRIVVREVRAFTIERDGDRLVLTLHLEAKGRTLTLRTAVWPRNR